ncbi:hypothetical protein V2I01_19605 [Micromonospora sp. BRA006-A]|nr:hypothetical protein [Micromonospora sp. BRA006-A]
MSTSIDDLLSFGEEPAGRTSGPRAAGGRACWCGVPRSPQPSSSWSWSAARGRPEGTDLDHRGRGARRARRTPGHRRALASAAAPRGARHPPARSPAPGTGPPGTRCVPRSTAGSARWTGAVAIRGGSTSASCPASASWPTNGCASATASPVSPTRPAPGRCSASHCGRSSPPRPPPPSPHDLAAIVAELEKI